ncbi:MAG: universal stress protein [Desulfobacteraceae bacterium]|nr:universal stress protein [Desulfobacteraceae bacterium]
MATIINKILFCSDLTKGSIKVFEQAVTLALQTNATISMLHVVQEEESTYKGEFIDWMDQELYARIKKSRQAKAENVLVDKKKGMTELQQTLKDYFKQTGKNMEEHQQVSIDVIEIREGKAALAIPEFAEEKGCDLIVLGYHQEGSFLRALMESGKKIMQRNSINVFLVFLEE